MSLRATVTNIVLFIILLIVVYYLTSKTRVKDSEHFASVSRPAMAHLKNTMGFHKCDALDNSNMSPENVVISKAYLDTGRIKKWQPMTGDPSTSNKEFCFVADDLPANEMDSLLSGLKCDKSDAYFASPMFSSVFMDKQQQTTTTMEPNVCVFSVDKNKATTARMNDFWSNVGATSCQRQNAYIVELYQQLILQSNMLAQDIFGLGCNIGTAERSRQNAVKVIGNLSKIVVSCNANVTALTQTVDTNSHRLAASNIVLGNIQTDFSKYQTTFKNQVVVLSNTYYNYKSQYDVYNADIASQIEKYNTNSNSYCNLSSCNDIVLAYTNQLGAELDYISPILTGNEQTYTQLTFDLSNCLYRKQDLQEKLTKLIDTYTTLYNTDVTLQNMVTTTNANLLSCTSKLQTCQAINVQLNKSIVWYTKALDDCQGNNVICMTKNSELNTQISTMCNYFDWVRTVYIYLSCATLEKNLADNVAAHTDLQTKCDNAMTAISSTQSTIQSAITSTNASGIASLEACESNGSTIRNGIMKASFPPNKYIYTFAICEPGQWCPIQTSNDADANGQSWCDQYGPLGSTYMPNRWCNVDGMRGGAWCCNIGTSEDQEAANASNLKILAHVGSTLPQNNLNYYHIPTDQCVANKFVMTCPNMPPYNFEFCTNSVQPYYPFPGSKDLYLGCKSKYKHDIAKDYLQRQYDYIRPVDSQDAEYLM